LPIQLDFGLVRTINSYGTRRLMRFMREAHPRKIEFHNCPSIFVYTMNIVKDVLGSPRDPSIVKSFAVPCFCADCQHFFDVMIATADVKPDQDDMGLGTPVCPQCGSTDTEADVDAEEHLGFLEP
jgi:hypothetical protein